MEIVTRVRNGSPSSGGGKRNQVSVIETNARDVDAIGNQLFITFSSLIKG